MPAKESEMAEECTKSETAEECTGTVSIAVIDLAGKIIVSLVFDGEDDDPVYFPAMDRLDRYEEVKNVKNSKGNAPRDKKYIALVNCHGGTLQYDGKMYRIHAPKQQRLDRL